MKTKAKEGIMFDVCVIGHVTRDIIRINNIKREMPGGVAYYLPITLKSLGLKVSVITKVGYKDEQLLDNLNKNNIYVFPGKSPRTSIFENIYQENLNFRMQKIKSIALPFTMEDIPDISTRIFHLGPLTKEDIPLEILRVLSKRSKISLDIQGYLRKVEKQEVKMNDWEEKDEGLTYVNILKTDEAEAKILSGDNDMRKAAVKLSAYGIDEIIITLGSKGSLIYSKEGFFSIPPFPPKRIVDATGCGDTYMAGYIHKRLKSSDINEAGRFAAAIASLKIEKFGPFKGSEEDIQKFLGFSKESI